MWWGVFTLWLGAYVPSTKHTHVRMRMRRATAASSDGLPLALCDAPWREVEDRRGGSGLGLGLGLGEGGDMVRVRGCECHGTAGSLPIHLIRVR